MPCVGDLQKWGTIGPGGVLRSHNKDVYGQGNDNKKPIILIAPHIHE